MGKSIDITGQRFGYLTAIKPMGRSKQSTSWLCKCDCGKDHITTITNLRTGDCKSCGCYKRESSRKRQTKHGMGGTRLNRIWQNMKERCNNPNNTAYKNYGKRGITYCKEWENFEDFYKWAIESGYNDDLTIDRINVNGNYCPENCRWATNEQQQYNKRTTHYLTYKGEKRSMAEWSKIKDINIQTLASRINQLNWSVERALETPAKKHKKGE